MGGLRPYESSDASVVIEIQGLSLEVTLSIEMDEGQKHQEPRQKGESTKSDRFKLDRSMQNYCVPDANNGAEKIREVIAKARGPKNSLTRTPQTNQKGTIRRTQWAWISFAPAPLPCCLPQSHFGFANLFQTLLQKLPKSHSTPL